MKIDLQIVNAAGNTTAMVFTKLDSSQYSRVGTKILESNRISVEQVAFIVPPTSRGHGRVEMMGGEFCCNATRCYGYYLNNLNPQNKDKVLIEISGMDQPLEISIDKENKCCYTKMPTPESIACFMKHGEIYKIVVYEGITHIIVDKEPQNNMFVKNAIDIVKKRYPSKAYGVLFYHNSLLVPAVYVEETKSLIWEGNCGSGAVALGVYLSRNKEAGEYKYKFMQPTGAVEVIITRGNRRLKSSVMGGAIEIYPPMTIEI